MNTLPFAMTGLGYVCEPSLADHLMFFPVLTSQLMGMFLAAVTLLRKWLSPNCGLSPGLTFIFANVLTASAAASYFASSAAGKSAAVVKAMAATKPARRRKMGMEIDPVLEFEIQFALTFTLSTNNSTS